MLFYIAEDDEATRRMLTEIIEDEDLGEVVGEAEDGSMIDGQLLTLKKADIVLIDLLMPRRDGIETIRHIGDSFSGKYVMISQVESKELIAEAYSLNVEYYILKPINRLEVLSVIKKVMERIRLERSLVDIHQSIDRVLKVDSYANQRKNFLNETHITASSQWLLSELGIISEKGCHDLLEILDYLFQYEHEETYNNVLPPLKDIFAKIAQNRLGHSASIITLNREIKASQQRVRRAIFQSLTHLASLGLTDFSNPIFDRYASTFFDFTTVRKRMTELNQGSSSSTSRIRVNTRKFIQALYYEVKQLVSEHQWSSS